MKKTRKLLCAALAAALLVLSVAPAYAAEVYWGATKLYLGSSNGSWSNDTWISIDNLNSNPTITNIRSSDDSIITFSNVIHSSWHSLQDDDVENDGFSVSIGIYGCRKGKATISFKVDGKAYSKAYEVLGYTNPIKSFVLTGVSKTNLKSKFAKTGDVYASLKKDAKAGNIKLAAAKGWRVTEISWSGNNNHRSFGFGSGVSSAAMPIPKMKKNKNYSMWMTFVNTKTKATLQMSYTLN